MSSTHVPVPQQILDDLDTGMTIDQLERKYSDETTEQLVQYSAQRLGKLRPSENGTLVVQLQELNVRSRVYMTQAWQVPFAYVATVAVLLGALLNKGVSREVAAAGFFVAAVTGVVVGLHQRGVMNGSRRAVFNIQAVELALGLGRTSEWVGPAVFGPITWLIWIVAALSAIAVPVIWQGGVASVWP